MVHMAAWFTVAALVALVVAFIAFSALVIVEAAQAWRR